MANCISTAGVLNLSEASKEIVGNKAEADDWSLLIKKFNQALTKGTKKVSNPAMASDNQTPLSVLREV
jgi:hypothetical protein